jgi:hypothetical protein
VGEAVLLFNVVDPPELPAVLFPMGLVVLSLRPVPVAETAVVPENPPEPLGRIDKLNEGNEYGYGGDGGAYGLVELSHRRIRRSCWTR